MTVGVANQINKLYWILSGILGYTAIYSKTAYQMKVANPYEHRVFCMLFG